MQIGHICGLAKLCQFVGFSSLAVFIMTRKRFTKEFRDEAVQLAINSDIPQRQLAEDLGIGKSTLFKWITGLI